MFRYLLLLVFIVSIFTSCSAKKRDLLIKGSLYHTGLEYTKVKTIYYKNDTSGILNITYLNPSYPDTHDKNYDEFLIGIYLDKFKDNYALLVNDKKYFSKELLNKNTPLYKKIPVFNQHAIYYIVKFKKEKHTSLNLTFKHTVYKDTLITFTKF